MRFSDYQCAPSVWDLNSFTHSIVCLTFQMPGEVMIGHPNDVPGEAILDVARTEGADLIVVGSRGLGPTAYDAGPRTTDIVVNNSEVTVFVNKV